MTSHATPTTLDSIKKSLVALAYAACPGDARHHLPPD